MVMAGHKSFTAGRERRQPPAESTRVGVASILPHARDAGHAEVISQEQVCKLLEVVADSTRKAATPQSTDSEIGNAQYIVVAAVSNLINDLPTLRENPFGHGPRPFTRWSQLESRVTAKDLLEEMDLVAKQTPIKNRLHEVIPDIRPIQDTIEAFMKLRLEEQSKAASASSPTR